MRASNSFRLDLLSGVLGETRQHLEKMMVTEAIKANVYSRMHQRYRAGLQTNFFTASFHSSFTDEAADIFGPSAS